MTPTLTRRDFLRAAALFAAAPAARAEAPRMPIIDTHQHLWDLTRFTLPWVKPGGPLARSFTLADYHAAAAGLGFDLCMRSAEMSDAGKLCDACPGTQFILDHCGNPLVHGPDGKAPDRIDWKRAIDDLAKRKNLVCKVSGLVNTAAKGAWGPD